MDDDIISTDYYLSYDIDNNSILHNKNINENFTLIGILSDINYLENEYKVLKIDSPDQKFTKRKLDIYEVVFE